MPIRPDELSLADFLSPSFSVRLEALASLQTYNVSPELYWDVAHLMWGWIAKSDDDAARSSNRSDEHFQSFTEKEQIELKKQSIRTFCETACEWDSMKPPFRDDILPRLISFIEDFRQQDASLLEALYFGLDRMLKRNGFRLEKELMKTNATHIIMHHLNQLTRLQVDAQSPNPMEAMEVVFGLFFRLCQSDPALDVSGLAQFICKLLQQTATDSVDSESVLVWSKFVWPQQEPSDLNWRLKVHALNLASWLLKNDFSRMSNLEKLAEAGFFEIVFNDLKGLSPSFECSLCFLNKFWLTWTDKSCKKLLVKLGLIPVLGKLMSIDKMQDVAISMCAGLDPMHSEELLKCGVLAQLLKCNNIGKNIAEFSILLANLTTGPCSEEVCGKLFEFENWLDLCLIYLEDLESPIYRRFKSQECIVKAMVQYGHQRVLDGSFWFNEVLVELNFAYQRKLKDTSLEMKQQDVSKSMLPLKIVAIRRLWKANVFLDGNVLKSSGNDALSLLYEFDDSLSGVIRPADSRRNLPPILGLDPLSDVVPRSGIDKSTPYVSKTVGLKLEKMLKPSILTTPPVFSTKHDGVKFENQFNSPLDAFTSLHVSFASSSKPIKKSSTRLKRK